MQNMEPLPLFPSSPDISYTLSENTTTSDGTVLPTRLVFDPQNSTELNGILTFTDAGVEFVDIVTVYVRVSCRGR